MGLLRPIRCAARLYAVHPVRGLGSSQPYSNACRGVPGGRRPKPRTRASTQASISSEYQPTVPALIRTRTGNSPAFSSRQTCAVLSPVRSVTAGLRRMVRAMCFPRCALRRREPSCVGLNCGTRMCGGWSYLRLEGLSWSWVGLLAFWSPV